MLEFKSSARVNMATGKKDDRLEVVILKTICAFGNSRGGTLLIDVDDEGQLIGLDPDLATLREPDADRFELWLRVGNSTRRLDLDEAVDYVSRRWPTPVSTSARLTVRDLGLRLRGRA